MVSKENRLRQCMELIPVLLFCVNIIMYGCFLASKILDTWYIMDNFFWCVEHFFNISLIAFILMLYISLKDKWRFLSKVCMWAILALWANNFPYVVLGYEPGIYFSIFAVIIYATALILCLRFLTRR